MPSLNMQPQMHDGTITRSVNASFAPPTPCVSVTVYVSPLTSEVVVLFTVGVGE